MSATSRPDRIGDAALALLTERGARGLTHRAVDERAELPPGSTSYYARSRSALLELALTRASALETANAVTAADGAQPDDPVVLANQVGDLLHQLVTDSRAHTIARYELALEATRRPELRAVYDGMGGRFEEAATEVLARLGSPAPKRHGQLLLAWCEGVLFRSTAGPDTAAVPTRRELRATARDLIASMLA
ncbi:MAG: TetR family transcriptional regulator [Streptosporangiales bacterium]|nr:TetR family transcriptional regulator [Streptosporangiales bacterium]